MIHYQYQGRVPLVMWSAEHDGVLVRCSATVRKPPKVSNHADTALLDAILSMPDEKYVVFDLTHSSGTVGKSIVCTVVITSHQGINDAALTAHADVAALLPSYAALREIFTRMLMVEGTDAADGSWLTMAEVFPLS